ncbi:hypothetical protein [Actibacterium sp. 188UL27-1]|uniref:hypothetical protein n=1 Tax=Actibacterium sp. 188UL27-1 TaxID=2786961 RepID=UPI00195605B9|nr:hypothetical protein [Actibacterium sp. 188UL27-1]MBM7066058.1 hypothetical protein [Actibacterium sp. 188UL27-1]
MTTFALSPAQAAPDARDIIDPVAFTLALIGAPCLVTLLTFWAVIPIFALGMGAPLYLLFGTPVMWRALRRGHRRKAYFAWLGFKTNAVASIVAFPILALFEGQPDIADALGICILFLAFGSIFAPLWGAVFAWLYAGPKPSIYTQ